MSFKAKNMDFRKRTNEFIKILMLKSTNTFKNRPTLLINGQTTRVENETKAQYHWENIFVFPLKKHLRRMKMIFTPFRTK